MPSKLPRMLLFVLASLSVTSFGVSMYLESFHLSFLARHPISVNLISGVVGFSTGALIVSSGFYWFTSRELRGKRRRLLREIDDLHSTVLKSGLAHGEYLTGAQFLMLVRILLTEEIPSAKGYLEPTQFRLASDIAELLADPIAILSAEIDKFSADRDATKIIDSILEIHRLIAPLRPLIGDTSHQSTIAPSKLS